MAIPRTPRKRRALRHPAFCPSRSIRFSQSIEDVRTPFARTDRPVEPLAQSALRWVIVPPRLKHSAVLGGVLRSRGNRSEKSDGVMGRAVRSRSGAEPRTVMRPPVSFATARSRRGRLGPLTIASPR